MNEQEKQDAINQLVQRFHSLPRDVPLYDMLAVAWNMGFDEGARTAVFDGWTEDDFADHVYVQVSHDDPAVNRSKLDDWRHLELVNAQIVRPVERSFVDGPHTWANVQVFHGGYWI